MTEHPDQASSAAAGTQPRDAPKTVYLHIGAPKTGTTALQRFLWHNRYELARKGICYPLRGWNDHFGASMDLRNEHAGSSEERASWHGRWAQVAHRITDWRAPFALYSSEFLGPAAPDRIRHAVDSVQPAEVHVIMTARDLARQIASDWQEQVKHRRSMSFTEFTRELIDGDTEHGARYVQMFWRQHNAVTVLSAWSEFVPANRIHLVTLPQRGGAPTTLFERFLSVLGHDLADFCLKDDERISNSSLGAVEAEYLRRLNPLLHRRLGPLYNPLVREVVAERLLSTRPNPSRIEFSRAYTDWVVERSAEIVSALRGSDYHVVGDLDDLLPLPPEGEELPSPESFRAPALISAANDVVAGLLLEVHELLTWNDELRRQLRAAKLRPATRRGADASSRHPDHGEGRAFLMEYGVPRAGRDASDGPRSGRRAGGTGEHK